MIEKLPELFFSDGNSQEKNSCFGFYCAQINAWDLIELFYFNEITWGLMWWQQHYLSCPHFHRQLTQSLIKHWNHIYLLCLPTSQRDCQSSCLFFHILQLTDYVNDSFHICVCPKVIWQWIQFSSINPYVSLKIYVFTFSKKQIAQSLTKYILLLQLTEITMKAGIIL